MRKKLPYLLVYFFFLVFILQIIGLIVLFLLPQPGQAADPAQFIPQVTIPDSEFVKNVPITLDRSNRSIGNYIQAIYKYSIGIVGVLAAVVLMFGGVSWIIAGGSAERVANAKAWISASLIGLALALSSHLILNTINPDLVNFKIFELPTPERTFSSSPGCCQYEMTCSDTVDQRECMWGNDYFPSEKGQWNFNSECQNGQCEPPRMCCYNSDVLDPYGGYCFWITEEKKCKTSEVMHMLYGTKKCQSVGCE